MRYLFIVFISFSCGTDNNDNIEHDKNLYYQLEERNLGVLVARHSIIHVTDNSYTTEYILEEYDGVPSDIVSFSGQFDTSHNGSTIVLLEWEAFNCDNNEFMIKGSKDKINWFDVRLINGQCQGGGCQLSCHYHHDDGLLWLE